MLQDRALLELMTASRAGNTTVELEQIVTDGLFGTAEGARAVGSQVVAYDDHGLLDMAGNVWEWTSDWYRPDSCAQLAATGRVPRNPRGPDAPYDPSEHPDARIDHDGTAAEHPQGFLPTLPKEVQRAESMTANSH